MVAEKRPDNSWVRQSFLLPRAVAGKVRRSMTLRDWSVRTVATGLFDFEDTTLGGNRCINPSPQFTHTCDLNELRFFDQADASEATTFRNAGRGMGRWYNETINRNAVTVHLRFGVPQFNSMNRFFGTFYNSDAARLANTGRGNTIAYKIGRLAGAVATIRLMPILTVFQAFRFFIDKPSTKYYYLKPTMATYWMAVQGILNTIAANMGFVQGMANSEMTKGVNPSQRSLNETEEDAAIWKRLLPDVYNSNGSIDIWKVSTRYQRLADRRYRLLADRLDDAKDPEDAIARAIQVYRENNLYADRLNPKGEHSTFDDYMQSYFELDQHKVQSGEEASAPNQEVLNDTPEETAKVLNQPSEGVDGYFGRQEKLASGIDDYGQPGQPDEKFRTFLGAELRDGAQFVTFKVDNPGTVGESFSNSVKESAIAQKMNGMSSGARDFRFNVADGNIADLGWLSGVLGAVTDAVSGLVTGLADSIGVSGLAALFGNGLVDIPKYWDSSTAELPRTSFSMELRSPYGNDLSRYQSLMVPLACILAGALPRSTGYQSYTSPFLCEMYCQGRSQTRLGIIDSIQITRGAGNIGWTADGKPLGIDITFNVLDLSSVMHMPITPGFGLAGPLALAFPGQIAKFLFGDETTFSDYMATLSSLGLIDQIYTTRRFKRNFYRTVLEFQSWQSPARWASHVSNSGWLFGAQPGRWLSAFATATERN